MTKYTIELNDLINQNISFQMTDYPLFDEQYRNILNLKILNHYRFYEIGFETFERFKFQFNVKLNEIMPYYNQLYKSELLTFNPLYSSDYTETFYKKSDSDSNINGSSTLTNDLKNTTNDKIFSIESDLPQTIIETEDIQTTNIYANSANRQDNTNTSLNTGTSESESNQTGKITNIDDYTKRIFGNTGAQNNAQLLKDFRTTFLNIDMMIINDLKELFLMIY